MSLQFQESSDDSGANKIDCTKDNTGSKALVSGREVKTSGGGIASEVRYVTARILGG